MLVCSAGAFECPFASRAASTRLAVRGNAGLLTRCAVMIGMWHDSTANPLDAVFGSVLCPSHVYCPAYVWLFERGAARSLRLVFSCPPLPPPPPLFFPIFRQQKFEEIYLKECAKARPAPEAKFNYAWALIRSPARPDIRKGVIMMSGLLEDRFSDRDCLYYMAHGHYRLDDVVVRCSCACM